MLNTLLQQINNSAIVQAWVAALIALFCVGIFLRWLLFWRLMEFIRWDWAVADITEQAPKLIRTLRQRMVTLLQRFDEVNTAALVDHVLAQEKLFPGLSLEQAESWTQTIPNILISLGLLGTFLGITINLSSIKDGLDALVGVSPEGIVSVAELIDKFRQPLEAMALAFITSLVGLCLGILLTVINSIYNTTLAKRHFFTAVELYLDYELVGQERNSTSRLIKSISDNFRIFLDNFRQVVTDAIEHPLEREMARIREMNERNAELAERIYIRFDNAAGDLVASSQIFSDAAEVLQRSEFADKFSLATQQLSQFTNQLTESGRQSQELNTGVVALSQRVSKVLDRVNATQIDFQSIAGHLSATTQVFTHIEKITRDLLNQVETVDRQVSSKSEELSKIVERLEGLIIFAQESQSNLSTCLDQLSLTHAKTTEVVERGTNQLNTEVTNLRLKVSEILDKLNTSQSQIEAQQIITQLDTTTRILTHIEEITLDSLNQIKSEEFSKINDRLENLALIARELESDLSGCFNELSLTHAKITELSAQERDQHEALVRQLQGINGEFVAYREQMDEKFSELLEELVAYREQIDEKFSELLEELVAYREQIDERFNELPEKRFGIKIF